MNLILVDEIRLNWNSLVPYLEHISTISHTILHLKHN